jgi:hypothetical protein
MAEYGDRQRIRPTVEGRARLLAAIEIVGPPHVIDAGALGEYAELVVVRGLADADARMPDVAAHLASGCASCADDLRDLQAALGGPDEPGSPATSPTPPPAPPSPPSGQTSGLQSGPPGATSGSQPRPLLDSGLHAASLPDPRAAEAAEAARRQRLRKIRDWLLIASAVSILLIGLSLVGMAYTASHQPTPRLGLSPATDGGVSGQAAPSGMNCPSTHPIKGNRESKIYHRPGQAFYDQTRPEDCFATPADAEAAGYRASQR